MNCMETRALVEDALDETLSGNQKRALDLHLSRCDGCRAYFAAERNEHRRWFKAMNEPYARRRLPDGFADNFVAAIANANAVPQRRWAFVGLFRRIAAVVAAMLLFAGLSYAAVVAVDELGGSEEEKAVAEMKLPESSVVSEGGLSSDAAISDGDGSPAASSLSISPEQQTGGSNMIKPKAAAAAFSVAMASMAVMASYNSLAPYTNTENTDFWDTRGYDVTPESSSAGVCGTALNRLVRTEAISDNIINSFRRIGLIGMIITFR